MIKSMIILPMLVSMNAVADENAEDIALKLSNPVASMISVPFQYNFDSNIGPNDGGDRSLVNIQPVIPISLNDDWNIISRTILPVTWQSDIFPGAGSQSGIGSIVQSLFFSPKAPTDNGWIWGAGPVFLLPTASNDLLGGDQWGAGPTAVALKQDNGWTYGGLFNHIWSFAQDDNAPISSSFIQPFVSYATKTGIAYTLNTESTYDWEREEWSVPINATVTKVTKWGDQVISYGGGVRYWADSTNGGPEGWGVRLIFTLVYPK
jgi:hypothetical protein